MFVFKKLGLLAGAAVISLSVLLPPVVSAQTPPARPPLNLTTSPLPLNVVTKPGQTVTADIRVKNNGTQPEALKVELLKFGASGDTGRPQLQEQEPDDVYFDWVSFSETTFQAEPNIWKTVKMNIAAPKEAAFGYYYAVLFSRAVPDRPTGGESGVEGGVASLVLLNVDAPGARREVKVAELTATQKVYEFLPATFNIRLQNTGNVHVSPIGNIFIKQGDKQVATLDFNDERGNILPGTNRVFEYSWNDGFPAYEEKIEGSETTRQLKWDFSKIEQLRFGKYTATLVAVYDDGQRDVPVEAIVSFWVVPWRFLGGLLLIVLLIGVGVWAVMRLIWRNVRRQALKEVSDKPDENSLAAATKSAKKPAAPETAPQDDVPIDETTDENAEPLTQEQLSEKKTLETKPTPAAVERQDKVTQGDGAASKKKTNKHRKGYGKPAYGKDAPKRTGGKHGKGGKNKRARKGKRRNE